MECGEPLRGRTDKKYCSDYCRNAFNNRLNRQENNLIRNVHNRLRRNYRILKTLPTEHIGNPIPKALLINQGFDFQSITKVMTEMQGSSQFWVYDIGFMAVNESQVVVVRETMDLLYE